LNLIDLYKTKYTYSSIRRR